MCCSRIITSFFAGALAGIAGVQGLPGFALYFAQHAVATLPMLLKASFAADKFYVHGCAACLPALSHASHMHRVTCHGHE